jgi:hypothetical protein
MNKKLKGIIVPRVEQLKIGVNTVEDEQKIKRINCYWGGIAIKRSSCN